MAKKLADKAIMAETTSSGFSDQQSACEVGDRDEQEIEKQYKWLDDVLRQSPNIESSRNLVQIFFKQEIDYRPHENVLKTLEFGTQKLFDRTKTKIETSPHSNDSTIQKENGEESE